MTCLRSVLFALVALLPAASLAADLKFVSAASDRFEVYTTDNQAVATAALEHFETARAYLIKSVGGVDPFKGPVRIVGYKSGNEFRSHLPGTIEAEHAFSKINGDSVTIVVDVLKKQNYEYALREYVNLLFARAAPNMAYWLRMGFRELYCTLRTGNGMILLGEDPFFEIRPASVLPGATKLSLLFQLNAGATWGDSAEAVRANNKLIALGGFDSTMSVGVDVSYRLMALQLTRSLMFDKAYSPKFGAFVSALVGGADTTATLKSVYGESLEDLAANLRVEWTQPAHPEVSFNFALPKPLEPRIGGLSAADSAALIAEIKARK